MHKPKEGGGAMQTQCRLVNTLFVLVGTLIVVTGCSSSGPRPVKDDSRDVLAHAKYIKNLTIHTLTRVPQLSKDEALGVLENMRAGLAQYESVPLGEFRETYQQLVEGTDELLELCRQGAERSQIKSRADALIEKAKTLPGDLEQEAPG